MKIDEKIYIFGKPLEHHTKKICIAGSRDTKVEYLQQAFELGSYAQHLQIVNGLAKGIDLTSLKGYVKNNTNPNIIGCIGTSPDRAYPKENKKLQEKLVQEHTLISLVDYGTTTNKLTFLKRNRVMADISDLIIILKTNEHSGCWSLLEQAQQKNKLVLILEDNKNLPWLNSYKGRFYSFSELIESVKNFS